MSETKVKICGLTRRVDAVQAAEAGADYLGAVLVPGSPRARTPDEAQALFYGIGVSTVIVVAEEDPGRIISVAEQVSPTVVQLHGNEPPDTAFKLRDSGPWNVWKALRVQSMKDVLESVSRFTGAVDGFLLDGWHPLQLGGTGTRFSWQEVSKIRGSFPSDMLFVAAGGLVPENVQQAVSWLHPHVVDVSSGVEAAPGIKDPGRVVAFIDEVRSTTRGGTG